MASPCCNRDCPDCPYREQKVTGMPYKDRYIKKQLDGTTCYEGMPVRENVADWYVYDTHAKQSLLGYYTEASAERTCQRLNADIDLSPNQMRALNTSCPFEP